MDKNKYRPRVIDGWVEEYLSAFGADLQMPHIAEWTEYMLCRLRR